MNTSLTGDVLERRIYDLLQAEIDAGRFWAKKANCKLFWKKGYFSKDRNTEIIFDVAIEIYLPDATEYSCLVLIECKNFARNVSVGVAEEFFARVQQVAAANSKAILATTSAFQTGTLEFARSKGIGLLRYFDPGELKWELKRSPSAAAVSTSVDAAMAVEDGLTRPDFSSLAFEMFLQSPKRQTNCLWDFMEDLVLDSGFSRSQARQVANRRTKTINQVPFLGKPELEDRSSAILSDLGYVGGEVSLDQLCARETWRSKLTVMTDVAPPTELGSAVLGRIVFDPLVIEVYAQPTPNRGRERFTLAHELAHHLLDHGRYLLHETCEDGDFVLHRPDLLNTGDIARMEFQANVLAACLLMPKACIIADFRRVARSLGIANKGFGELYVDAQPCNLMNYEALTHQLMECYGVSRAAIKIRLESLGLLCDARDQTNLHSVQRLLSQA